MANAIPANFSRTLVRSQPPPWQTLPAMAGLQAVLGGGRTSVVCGLTATGLVAPCLLQLARSFGAGGGPDRPEMRLPTSGAQAGRVWAGLKAAVDAAYAPSTTPAGPMPRVLSVTHSGASGGASADTFCVRAVPDEGTGLDALPEIWAEMVEHSAKLASPWCMGHMDTAPHPAAALTDAVVSSLNNNLLFREISPLASVIEEQLIEEFSVQVRFSIGFRPFFDFFD